MDAESGMAPMESSSSYSASGSVPSSGDTAGGPALLSVTGGHLLLLVAGAKGPYLVHHRLPDGGTARRVAAGVVRDAADVLRVAALGVEVPILLAHVCQDLWHLGLSALPGEKKGIAKADSSRGSMTGRRP